MTSTEEVQPVKRRPGRPRKVAAEVVVANPPDAWKNGDTLHFPADENVGERVTLPGCTGITFPDGREYRVENGVIVERVR
jgi:hypothetical protein